MNKLLLTLFLILSCYCLLASATEDNNNSKNSLSKNWLGGSEPEDQEDTSPAESNRTENENPETNAGDEVEGEDNLFPDMEGDDVTELGAGSSEPTGLKFADYVELDAENHIVLRGPVTEDSVSRMIVNISKIHHDDIVLYISSPGGSVIAGQNLVQQINYLQHRGRKVYCVADIAASMAFAILQACDERYVTPSSLLMQHQMSVSMAGQYFNVKSRQRLLDAIETDMTRRQAARMGLSEDEFTDRITSDWWLYGEECVAQNAADAMVQVGCHNDLLEKTVEEIFYVPTFLGNIPVKVLFSACPLAREPLEVKSPKGYMEDLDMFEQKRLIKEINAGLLDTLDIYHLNELNWQTKFN